MYFKRLSDLAKLPTKRPKDGGYDLYATEAVIVQPGGRRKVKTDIAAIFKEGTMGLVWPRSGTSDKNGIDILGGAIDEIYTGEIQVILQNHSNEAFRVEVGQKIAQMLVVYYLDEQPEEWVGDMPQTERGSNGFGSTG